MHSMAAALVLIAGLGNGPIKPYEAEVVQEDAVVRSGPGKSHFETSRLHRGEKVRVHRQELGGWCMITPPPGSFNIVPADAVKKIPGSNKGEIIGLDVAARIGSEFGEHDERVKTVLSEGDRVEILGDLTIRGKRMLKIKPPQNDFRWIEGKSIAAERRIVRGNNSNNDDPFGEGEEEEQFGVTPAPKPKRDGSKADRPAPKPKQQYEDRDNDRDWDSNDKWSKDDDRRGDRGRDDDHADHDHADHDHDGDHDHNGNRGKSGLRERPLVRTKGDQAVRRSLPHDDEISAERRRLDELDDQFRQIVNRHPSQWRFRELEEDYRRLQADVSVPAIASQIQLRLNSVNHYKELRSEYRDYVQLASQTSQRDAQLLSMQRSGDANPGGTRFPLQQAGGWSNYPAPRPHHDQYSSPQWPAPAPAPEPASQYYPASQYQQPAPPPSGYQSYGAPQYAAPAPAPGMAPAPVADPQFRAAAPAYSTSAAAEPELENPVPAPGPAENFTPPAGPSLAAPEAANPIGEDEPAPTPAAALAPPTPDPAAAFGPAPSAAPQPLPQMQPQMQMQTSSYPSAQPTFVSPQQQPNPYAQMQPPQPQSYPQQYQQQYPQQFPQQYQQQGMPAMPAGPQPAPFGAQQSFGDQSQEMFSNPQQQPNGAPFQGTLMAPQGNVVPPEHAFAMPQGEMPGQPGAPQSPNSFAPPQSGLVPAQGSVFAPPPPTGMPAPSGDAQRPQFDGTGIVQRSATATPGGPQHVLLTPNGKVLAFLQGEPGVNLDSYVGQPMGLHGQQSHRPDLSANLLSVRSATPVRLKQPASQP